MHVTFEGFAGNLVGAYFPINRGWVFIYDDVYGSGMGYTGEDAPESEMDRSRLVQVTIEVKELVPSVEQGPEEG